MTAPAAPGRAPCEHKWGEWKTGLSHNDPVSVRFCEKCWQMETYYERGGSGF